MTLLQDAGNRGLALRASGVRKSFFGVPALSGVDLTVRSGSIHALVGGNGSGKSTLIKIMAGVLRADDGMIALGQREQGLSTLTPLESRRLGMRFVHQDPGIVSELTVAENVGLVMGFPRGVTGGVAWTRLSQQTRDLLDRFEVHARPDQKAGDLRPAMRTMLAIARALGDDADGDRTLVLDEPTASLPAHEVDVLLDALQRRARAGQTIVYVSHRLEEIRAISDHLTVLRDGTVVADRPTGELSQMEIVELMSGEPLSHFYPPVPDPPTGALALEASAINAGPLRDVDLSVRVGEILGVAGLLGSGRSTLLRALFGDIESGARLTMGGVAHAHWSRRKAMQAGVAFVPEDRPADALFGTLTVRENFSIASLPAFTTGPRVMRRRERRQYRRMVSALSVKTANSEQLISGLSGGNAQKVVLGRWLERRPGVILLDEPTQGVDAMARADIYHQLREQTSQGAAIVLASSDFEELAHLCDRVIVLRAGRIVTELCRPHLSISTIVESAYADDAVAVES